MWWKFLKPETPGAPSAEAREAEGEIRAAGRAPLTAVAKQVKHVEVITKKKTSMMLSGEYKSRFKGQGMQFSDSRVYQYGDDIRHIDWRTTARMQETYVKTFEEERELNILFVVDASGSTLFGSPGVSKREAVATALACLGFSAIANNDRVGLIFFSDRVERFIPAKKGKKHILRLIDEILTFQPRHEGSAIDSALEFISASVKQGAVVILASDFFAPIDKRKLNALARKHDFICLRSEDPRDREIPDVGLLRVEDPETGEAVILPTQSAKLRQEYQRSQRAFGQQVEQIIKKSGAFLLPLSTDEEAAVALHRFFRSRGGRRR